MRGSAVLGSDKVRAAMGSNRANGQQGERRSKAKGRRGHVVVPQDGSRQDGAGRVKAGEAGRVTSG